ncbi:MAG: energy transducer TonB [Candidatus Eremiobacteraeota bacterium]|nr:energy transducer TonB [Candidatus Eremiobacteraeota bacterium]
MTRTILRPRLILQLFLGFSFAIAVLCAGAARASANPFCAVDIQTFVPWSATENAPSATAATSRYAVVLDTQLQTATGLLELITNERAYEVPFTDPATPFFITLDKAEAVKYAYVDDLSDGSKRIDCPTVVRRVDVETPAEVAADEFTIDDNAPKAVATFRENLPPLTCQSDYLPATISKRDAPTEKLNGVTAGAAVQLQLFLDSAGHLAAANVYKSSGDADLDRLALKSVARSTYQPALFRCVPVVGSFLYTFTYQGE